MEGRGKGGVEWSGEGEREGRGRAPSLLAVELRINMTLDSGEGGEGSRFSLTLFLPFFVWGRGGHLPVPPSHPYIHHWFSGYSSPFFKVAQ